jgi:cold shock CspA family protein
MEGTMLWFDPAKRHGFIHTDDGFAAGHVRMRGRR